MGELIAGRYEPFEVIGTGGHGRVIRAKDRRHDRDVALKLRRIDSAGDRARVLAEAALLLRMRPHPALPLVRDDFFDNDDYVLVLDWIEGASLANVLLQRGDPGLPASAVVSYVTQVAAALDHLHAHDPPIVHGDVKPANVILGSGGRVVLVDFSVAAPVGSTCTGGTTGYMAPEVAAGEPSAPPADIYGLAATTFTLLTGERPRGVRPMWEGLDPRTTPALERALRRGLSLDPARRPACAGDFLERLVAWHRAELPTGVLTFMLTDLEGSTGHWERDSVAMSDALARHDAVVGAIVEDHRGTLIKQQGEGDSTLSVFMSATDAVAAALELQRALGADLWAGQTSFSIRVALYTGDAGLRNGDYFGPTLNRAARLRSLAAGGQIVVSAGTAELVAGRLPEDVTLVDRGEHTLRGTTRAEHVHQLMGPGLDSNVLPVAVGTSTPHNLPEELSNFVGRRHELEELREIANTSRLLTLVGAGGAGKTRLACKLGAEVLGASEGGVWLIELARLADPSLVIPTVAFVLGIADQPGRPPIDVLTDALGNRSLRLILDNCEHLLDAAAHVTYAVLTQCPHVTVVATSREPLNLPGERLYRVPSLTVPPTTTSFDELMHFESVQLFVDRAVQHHSSFALTGETSNAVASICRRLDGIPLALELAAARLRSLSVADIDQRLDQRFQLLTGASSVVIPRQQTLRAMVDWSYDLLKDREQLVFARLAAFAGGWTVDAAEAIAADDTTVQCEDVLDILCALADKNLIESEPTGTVTRYRFLETIRAYAVEQLDALGEYECETTRRRHLQYFLGVAENAAPHLIGRGQAPWLEALDSDYDNIRRAFATIDADPSDEATDAGLRLAGAMFWFWGIRSHTREGTKLTNTILERPDARPPTLLRAPALISLGWLGPDQGEFTSARARLDEAIAIARRFEDGRVLSDALEARGWLSLQLEDPATAARLAEEAVANARRADDSPRIARALTMLGTVAHDMGNEELARLALDEAVMRTEALDDWWELARALNQRAMLMIEAGDVTAARELVERSRDLQATLGTSVSVANSNLALIAVVSGKLDLAARLWAEALRLAQSSGSPRYELVDAIAGHALTASACGDHARAAVLHGAADCAEEQPGLLRARLAFKWLSLRLRQEDRARLLTALGPEMFEQQYSKGRQLSTAETIAIALEQ